MNNLTEDMKLFLNYKINEKLQNIEYVNDKLLAHDLKIFDDFVSVFDNVDSDLSEEIIEYCKQNKNKIHKKFKNFPLKPITRCLNKEQIEFVERVRCEWIKEYGNDELLKTNILTMIFNIKKDPLFSCIPKVTINYVVAVKKLLLGIPTIH